MNNLEIIKKALMNFEINDIPKLIQNALSSGEKPMQIIDVLREGMEEIGKLYENGEYFLSELIMSGETMKEALKPLEQYMNKEKERHGTIVLGTITGDLHDIGKNIVYTLLSSAGFNVIDLGIDVLPETFIQVAEKKNANIISVSALLSTAIPYTAKIVSILKKAGKRDRFKVIVGGAAAREWNVEKFGVDAAVNSAVQGVDIIKQWMERK